MSSENSDLKIVIIPLLCVSTYPFGKLQEPGIRVALRGSIEQDRAHAPRQLQGESKQQEQIMSQTVAFY